MTGRMTKDEADKAWAEFPFHGDGDAWAEPVAAEFWRARSEEARLLREAQAKDEQIETLADALRRAEPFVTDGDIASAVAAALRLAGR